MSDEKPGLWARLFGWADGEIPDDYAHDEAWIQAHTNNEGYFRGEQARANRARFKEDEARQEARHEKNDSM